jgi:UDP-N-acetylmuramyl pentapeptide phosphotransferase/UDP-N-acetylglucosamine-1-phosphate transferase
MLEQAIGRLAVLAAAAVVALILSVVLILVLRPWLLRYAMARPNARSSHRVPTPQGGGIAVIAATLAATWATTAWSPSLLQGQPSVLIAVTAAATLLAVVGAVDDLRPLPAAARLIAQFIAVGVAMAALPGEFRLLPDIPAWLERACLVVGGVWLVNLTNFMDGIDWMTVAEVVPVTGALVLLGLIGMIDPLPALIAAALFGAALGFAPFNRPVAKLFLGDVGSLPIGLLLGWLLLQLAGRGHVAAALILPLYYIADATITVVRRIARGEPFWQAHRMHFYQQATDNGFTVPQVVARVFLVNLALTALALASVGWSGIIVSVPALTASVAAVVWLLATFARPRR